ncbi:MAG: spore cortex biosynthesis protein YabQ [Clostridiales bacterium]
MFPIYLQLAYVFLTVALGMGTGLLYDIYALLFHWRKPKGFFRWLWDISFWIFIFILVYYFLMRILGGDFRLWVLLALGAGQLIYHKAWRANKKILSWRRKLAGLLKKSANKDKLQ